MANHLTLPKEKIAQFCHRNHIHKLALFGSVLHDDFGPESDIDVLVEFEAGAIIGFFELYDMEQELSSLLDGRKVDLNTPDCLSKYFRDRVIAEAEVHYVKS
jgi:predicted nucleotidyltransferase